MPAPAASHSATINLPLFDWAEERYLLTKEGKRLPRWGSVNQACAILGDCDPKVIHALCHAGVIRGYKLNPSLRNSHFRVDLLGTWQHKQRQLEDH